MEKLMQRGKNVFSLKNEEEMDFNDVFGGPPKRFSLQEFGARLSSESEEDKTSSSPWREKPVFGEEVRARRRQNQNQNQQSDEFFNDIFKGGVESYRDRDSSFGSNPGSRIMSPLPPKPDHFPTSLPLPAHFSLPAKVTKGMELPTFGSSSPPLSRFSSRSNDDEVHPHQSHSSYESCFIVKDNFDTRNKGDNAFNQFHFSIYKWAGKGVSMLNDFKSTTNSNSNGRRVDIRSSSFTKTKSAPAVDKQETKDTVVPPKKETEFVNPQLKKTIHAFLDEDDHQEMKDKKPKTPRVDDEMKNRKVENSSSLKLGEMNEKKSVRKKNVKEFVKQEGEAGDVAAKDNKSGHASFKVVEDLKKHQPVQPSQPSTTPNIKSSAETLHTDSKENADDPLDDNFMVEEIFDAQENAADSESSDDTKAIDAKIRQWSVGKKGNIRSLLSTLQYVLWAESGWKAVPLVDLIEANSVKRAYQKALLRLHPDKLQQKGASFHHKYTAEKVFDILQEAWDHFNTSSLSM